MKAHLVTVEQRGSSCNPFKALEIVWMDEIYFVLPRPGNPVPAVLGPASGIEVLERHQAVEAPSEIRKAAAEMVTGFEEWRRQWDRLSTPAILEFFNTLPPITMAPAATATRDSGEQRNWMAAGREACDTQRGTDHL